MTKPKASARTVNDLADIIREVDPDNTLPPRELGMELAVRIPPFSEMFNNDGMHLVAFVERTNPDKQLGAGRLAELLVAEFNLDKEQ